MEENNNIMNTVVISNKKIRNTIIASIAGITIMSILLSLQIFVTYDFCNDDKYNLSVLFLYQINNTTMCFYNTLTLIIFGLCSLFWFPLCLYYLYKICIRKIMEHRSRKAMDYYL